MSRTIYGGAVWEACPLTPIAEIESFGDIVAELSWLPVEQAREIATRLLEGEDPVIAGYASARTGLIPEPPAEAEEIGRSRYGDPVFLVPGTEPDWVYEDLQGEVFEPYYVVLSEE